MLQNSQRSTESRPHSETPVVYTSPGKVFILGEYAVLRGLPALVAAVGPRFEMEVFQPEEEGFDLAPFHPQSPVARLLDWADSLRARRLRLEFLDSYPGIGGFGGSSAQFALAYRALADSENWETDTLKVWRLYRELSTAGRGLPPSGADLVAQWNGGIVQFNPETGSAEDLFGKMDWSNVLVFSAGGQAGRKVATHEHLATLQDQKKFNLLISELKAPLERGLAAVRAGVPVELGIAMNEYAEVLRRSGLELPATTLDREAFSRVSGVIGVKGAGALQADAIVVLLDPTLGAKAKAAARIKVIGTASSRELTLVCDGIERQSGISCLN